MKENDNKSFGLNVYHNRYIKLEDIAKSPLLKKWNHKNKRYSSMTINGID